MWIVTTEADQDKVVDIPENAYCFQSIWNMHNTFNQFRTHIISKLHHSLTFSWSWAEIIVSGPPAIGAGAI